MVVSWASGLYNVRSFDLLERLDLMLLQYPRAPRADVCEQFHGIAVSNPYFPLESSSAVTNSWLSAQEELTTDYLRNCSVRQEIADRLLKSFDYPRASLPYPAGKQALVWHQSGLEPQPVLHLTADPAEPGRILLDPNSLSDDGTVAISGIHPDPEGKRLAWTRSDAGSDWQQIQLLDMETGEDLGVCIDRCRFGGVAWEQDGNGFYYSRYPAQSEAENAVWNRIYFHQPGRNPDLDPVIFERTDDRNLLLGITSSADHEHFYIYEYRGTDLRNGLLYRKSGDDGDFIRLFAPETAHWGVIGHRGTTLYLLTDAQAPRRRVVTLDLNNPGQGVQHLFDCGDEVIESAVFNGRHFILDVLCDGAHELRLYSAEGLPAAEVTLPGLGSLHGLVLHPRWDEVYLSHSIPGTPSQVYRLDEYTGRLHPVGETPQRGGPEVVTERVFVTSADGTRLPMFITYRKNLPKDGNRPVLLYGYGGFAVSITPNFQSALDWWFEQGGIYASTCLRGGFEYGEDWHQAGMKENKIRVFEDFIASAELLVRSGWTRPRRIAIKGGSNGGLLVAATLLRAADKIGAGICCVPLTDMLRFTRFTVGSFWIPEYGDPYRSEEEFRIIREYSPLHNIDPAVEYPPLLVPTADHDDRVVPAHAFKFVAALQESVPRGGPWLLRLERRAGHGAGKPVGKLIAEWADIYAFLHQALQLGE